MHVIAWTGGTRPRPLLEITHTERQIVHLLFREQMEVNRAFWGAVPFDVARTLWGRARYDAHATMREATLTKERE